MPEEQRLARRATTWRSAALWAAVSGVVTRRARELGRPLRVLDLGGGTGGVAVPLAGANHHVTVVDPSPNALAALQRRAVDSGAAERITALQGDADTLAQLLPERGFDLVCCHGVLEVVDDPEVTLAAVAEALAGDGYLSLLVAGRLAAVLAKTLAGEFSTAAALLSSESGSWGAGDPLRRRFDVPGLDALLRTTGLVTEVCHGVRLFSDLVPSAYLDTDADRTALLDLEQAAVTHPDYAFLTELGAGLHVLARRS